MLELGAKLMTELIPEGYFLIMRRWFAPLALR